MDAKLVLDRNFGANQLITITHKSDGSRISMPLAICILNANGPVEAT